MQDKVICPSVQEQRRHIYNQFVIKVQDRDKLRAYLSEKQISTAIYYPLPLHLQPCFTCWGKPSLPISEDAAKTTLALPIYPELTMEQKQSVVEGIWQFYNK